MTQHDLSGGITFEEDVPFLRRYGWLIAIAAAYLYVFPYYPKIRSANELPRAYLVKAIVEDHTFAVERQVARYDWSPDLSEWGGHKYSNKAPGSSFLAVPVYAAVRAVVGEPSLAVTMWLCRVVTGIVPALLLLWLLWGALARLVPEPEVRRLVLVAYAFGSLALTYSLLFFSHQLSAVVVAGAWILGTDYADGKRRTWAIAAAGCLAGCAPLVDYEAAFAIPPVAAYVLWRMPRDKRLRAVAIAAAAGAIPIAGLLAYHDACFGSPFRASYAASTTYAADHAHGLLGMTYPHADAVWGSLFAADNGLFVLMPWLLLAIPGGVLLWRRGERADAVLAAAIAAIFVYFVSSFAGWRGGWEVGPRYVTAMLPFLLAPIGAALGWCRSRPVVLAVVCGTIVSAVGVYALSTATMPYWHTSLHDPLYELTFRLVGAGAFAPTAGSAFGLPPALAILPFLALAFGATGCAIWRVGGWRALALAAVIGAAILGAFALVPHGGAEPDRVYDVLHAAVPH